MAASNIGLTASKLSKQSNRAIINSIVKKQIEIIDAKITTAHQSGFNSIKHELPDTFVIANMDKSDAQIMIYYQILLIYNKPESQGGKGINARIQNTGVNNILLLAWLNGMTDEERKQKKALISKYSQ